MEPDDVDRARWDTAHQNAVTPTLSRIKRETLAAALPPEVEPTTMWPSWPLDRVAAELELQPGEVLVDVGCGRGEIGLWIADHLDVEWVGVEPSTVGQSAAGDRSADRARARPARVADGQLVATGLPSGSADAVLLVDVLHFSTDLPATFAELARVLRAGRRLVLVGPHRVDPRSALAEAGFGLEVDEETAGLEGTLALFAELVRAEADALRREIGEVATQSLLEARLEPLSEIWHGLLVARRAG